MKFAEGTSISQISNNDEISYHKELNNQESSLLLSVSKTKELVTDFRKKERKTHTPVYISGAEVEQVNSFRFLGISITENLSWSSHTTTMRKKAQKWLYFLGKLKRAKFLLIDC